jgi:hypothetical protein
MIREWKKILFLILLLLILFFLYNWLDDEGNKDRPLVGVLKSQKGSVKFRQEEVSLWKITSKNQDFFDRDVLETGPNSSAEIELSNGRRIVVSEESQVILSIQKNSSSETLNLVLKSGFIRTKDGSGDSDKKDNLTIKVGDLTYKIDKDSSLDIQKIDGKVDFQVTKGNIQVLDQKSSKENIIRKDTPEEEIKKMITAKKENGKEIFTLQNIKNGNVIWLLTGGRIPFYFEFSKSMNPKYFQVVMKLEGYKTYIFYPEKNKKNGFYYSYIDFNMIKENGINKNSSYPGKYWQAFFGFKNKKTDQILWDDKVIPFSVIDWDDLDDRALFSIQGSFSGNGGFFHSPYQITPGIPKGQESFLVYGKKNLQKAFQILDKNQFIGLSYAEYIPEQSIVFLNKKNPSYLLPLSFAGQIPTWINFLEPNFAYKGHPMDLMIHESLKNPSGDILSLMTSQPYIFAFSDKEIKKIKTDLLLKNSSGKNLVLEKSRYLFKREVSVIYH